MTQYAISTLPGRVLGFAESDTMPVLHDAATIAHVMVEPVTGFPQAPTPTSELWIANGELYWVEKADLTHSLADAIATIDRAADAVRTTAIGDPARAIEYQRAEIQARAYAAAGYSGTVPRCVLAWATPKGWTGQQAADDIIATANAWYEALDTIREMRLAAKEAARAIAANPEGTAGAIYAVQATFLSTLHALMQGLQ